MSSPEYDSAGMQPSLMIQRRNNVMNGVSGTQAKPRRRREYKTSNYPKLPKSRGAIRILELFSSEKSDAGVLCSLIVPLEHEREQYPYEALSWCWGKSRKLDYIRIQSSRKTYDKFVSPNLVAALKALRYPNRSRYLWVDMVCINQDDFDEKNHQVEMMDIIYGNAERVCIWLGEANESSRMALQFIKKEVSHLQSFDMLCDSKDASKKWVALLDLMQRPWFSRRWVVQELALAKKALIYCGSDKISWKKFAIAVELFVEVETATHRLSEVMKKDRQYQYIPSYFEFVSALGASLLVDATERLFRDYQEIRTNEPVSVSKSQAQLYDDRNSESDTSLEGSDSDDDCDSSTSLERQRLGNDNTRNRIQPLLSLEYLVSSLTIFETTVPHDTIYALLAIAKDTTPRAADPGDVLSSRGAQEGLEVYTQRKSYNVDYNLPYVDVCKDFISFSIERSLEGAPSRALDVICRPWAIDERRLKNIRDEKKREKEKKERDRKREKDREQRRANKTEPETTNNPITNSMNLGASPSKQAVPNTSDENGSTSETRSEWEDMPLPSWVPQLSGAPYAMAQRPGLTGLKMSRINADPLVGLPSLTQRNYSAAETKGVDMKALKFRKRPSLGHFSMYVRGFRLDVVKEVEQVARNGQIPREWAELGGWENAKGHPPDAFWRTLVANRGKEGKNPPVYYSRACEESFKKGGLESGAVDTTALIDYERNSVVAQFCRRVQAVTWNRALVKTEKGRLALVGKEVEKGDLVCILYGCSVPIVLRASKRKEDGEFKIELEQELKDVKNSVVQCFKRYMIRKRRHEARKNMEMAQWYRRWLKTKHFLQRSRFIKNDTLDGMNLENLTSGVLSNILLQFRAWLYLQQQKQWPEQERRIIEEKNARKNPNHLSESIPEQLRYKLPKRIQETQMQRKRKKSRSGVDMVDMLDPLPIKDRSSNNIASGSAKDSAVTSKSKKLAIDWWEFEYALVAGRLWRKIVQERKEERAKVALQNTKKDRDNHKFDDYQAFKNWRVHQEKWVEPKSAKAITTLPTDTVTRSSTEETVVDLAMSTNGQKSSDMATNGIEKSGEVESDLRKRYAGLEARPSWARKMNQDRLLDEEGEKYSKSIRDNLKGRLGDEGYFSYRLLGECYIHGVMDGEAMLYQNERKDEAMTSTIFEIR